MHVDTTNTVHTMDVLTMHMLTMHVCAMTMQKGSIFITLVHPTYMRNSVCNKS